MGREQIIADLHALAGRLPHRNSNTESEREAAEYIHRRMRHYAPDAMLDPFDSIDSWALLFSAYYAEFFLVALVATFYPAVGFFYGISVFVLYLAEFTGYHVLTRFLPQYGSQNVMGRLLAERPERLVVVTAHYDTGPATWLTESGLVPWLRWVHAALVFAMVAILVSCAAEAFLDLAGPTLALLAWVRWTAVAILASAAIFLLLSDRAAEDSRGAVSNASGVASMLALAERLHHDPVPTTEILLLATGSSAAGFNGIHHFLRHQELDRELTFFLNFDQAGAERLGYTRGEGMLHVFRSSKVWCALAGRHAATFRVTPFTLTCLPTDMLLAAARGYQTISIMGTDDAGVPPLWRSAQDVTARASPEQIERAASFAEALIRGLAAGENG